MARRLFGAAAMFIGVWLLAIWVVTAAHGPHALGVGAMVGAAVSVGALLMSGGR